MIPEQLQDFTEFTDTQLNLCCKVSKSTVCHVCGAYIGDLEDVWYSFTGMDHNGKMISEPICDECFDKRNNGISEKSSE